MNTGTILLNGAQIVVIGNLLVAIYFCDLAERAESGEVIQSGMVVGAARRFSPMMFISAPLMWIFRFLVRFGVIPTGIETNKF